MQIITLELYHYDLYSPSTGELICGEEMGYNEKAKSLMGYWIDEVFMEPFIKDKSLKVAWEQLVSACEVAQEKADEDGTELDEAFDLGTDRLIRFLTEYDAPTWIVFQIGCSDDVTGMAIDNRWFVVEIEK
jgi:hypothetical protein